MAIAVRDLRPVQSDGFPSREVDFDDFYRTYFRRVRGLVRRRISDRELATEVVQDTFLRAHANFGRLDHHRSSWPWLATVASNLCVDALRRQRAGSVADSSGSGATDGTEDVIDWSADPADAFDRSLRAGAVVAALAEVPLRQRQVLVLKDAEGWTAEEIARLDGASTEGVKSLVRRARTTFRASYERIAEERGVKAAFGLAAAPLARLRARMTAAAGTRFAAWGMPVLGLPFDPSQILGAAALSGLLFMGAVPAAAEMVPISSVRGSGADATAPASGVTDGSASGDAPGPSRTAVGVATPGGAPAASVATAAIVEDGAGRTLEGIIATKVGDTGADGETRVRFSCSASSLREAVCDAAEAAPDLNGDE